MIVSSIFKNCQVNKSKQTKKEAKIKLYGIAQDKLELEINDSFPIILRAVSRTFILGGQLGGHLMSRIV